MNAFEHADLLNTRLERVERDRDEWKDAACKLEQRAEEAERERDAALRVKGPLVEALERLLRQNEAMGFKHSADEEFARAAIKAAKETP